MFNAEISVTRVLTMLYGAVLVFGMSLMQYLQHLPLLAQ